VQPAIEAVPLMARHDNQICMFGPRDADNSLRRGLGAQHGIRVDTFTAQRTHELAELAINQTPTCPA
jgi:hypothetical protein